MREGLGTGRLGRQLGVARNTVRSVLRELAKNRAEGAVHPPLKPPVRRASSLDRFEEKIKGLLRSYPDITAMRVLEELRLEGFRGGYSIVKEHVRRLRPSPRREPVSCSKSSSPDKPHTPPS